MTRPFLLGGPRDHPRSRGVYAHLKRTRPDGYGSSPLVRGLLVMACASRSARGIIPARVGFTCEARERKCRRPDHPRSRGVYWTRIITAKEGEGSSPLARGLPLRGSGSRSAVWIIPARAGFTGGNRLTIPPYQDHPRSRGVYLRSPSFTHLRSGSSPLARGLPARRRRFSRGRGIIPARAGFTAKNSGRFEAPQDHPRSRGVYAEFLAPRDVLIGSSPLARGLQRRIQGASKPLRIIPARAGFTPECSSPPRKPRDHPRSRGVYSTENLAQKIAAGSSPLARGLRTRRLQSGWRTGIIPARAGFTLRRTAALSPSWDHPRSRGVYSTTTLIAVLMPGSSPLARGLLHDHADRRLDAGIIPARAGFTHLLRSGCADS